MLIQYKIVSCGLFLKKDDPEEGSIKTVFDFLVIPGDVLLDRCDQIVTAYKKNATVRSGRSKFTRLGVGDISLPTSNSCNIDLYLERVKHQIIIDLSPNDQWGTIQHKTGNPSEFVRADLTIKTLLNEFKNGTTTPLLKQFHLTKPKDVFTEFQKMFMHWNLNQRYVSAYFNLLCVKYGLELFYPDFSVDRSFDTSYRHGFFTEPDFSPDGSMPSKGDSYEILIDKFFDILADLNSGDSKSHLKTPQQLCEINELEVYFTNLKEWLSPEALSSSNSTYGYLEIGAAEDEGKALGGSADLKTPEFSDIIETLTAYMAFSIVNKNSSLSTIITIIIDKLQPQIYSTQRWDEWDEASECVSLAGSSPSRPGKG